MFRTMAVLPQTSLIATSGRCGSGGGGSFCRPNALELLSIMYEGEMNAWIDILKMIFHSCTNFSG